MYLEILIEKIQSEVITECKGEQLGCQIRIALAQRIDTDNESIGVSGEKFAQRLFEAWDIESFQCQTGILVFISGADKFISLKVSQMHEAPLTATYVQSVKSDFMLPYLKHKKYYKALTNGLKEIVLILENQIQNTNLSKITTIVYCIFIAVIGYFIIGATFVYILGRQELKSR